MSDKFPEIDFKAVGSRVEMQREVLGLSPVQLAAKAGIAAETLRQIEYGNNGISLKTLYRLHKALHISMDYLLEGDMASPEEDDKKQFIIENIVASMSVCSIVQLQFIQYLVIKYVQSIVDKE